MAKSVAGADNTSRQRRKHPAARARRDRRRREPRAVWVGGVATQETAHDREQANIAVGGTGLARSRAKVAKGGFSSHKARSLVAYWFAVS